MLACGAEGDVNAAVIGHHDYHEVSFEFCALVIAQVRIIFEQLFYLWGGEIFFFAESFGINVGGGNSVSDEERFGAIDAALGKKLIVFDGSAMIGVAFEGEMRVRFES